MGDGPVSLGGGHRGAAAVTGGGRGPPPGYPLELPLLATHPFEYLHPRLFIYTVLSWCALRIKKAPAANSS